MPRVLVLCLATALLSGAAPVLAQDAKPAPVPPAAPASPPAPAAVPAASAATPTSASDDDATRRRSEVVADRRAMFEARLAALRAGLLLTPEQEKMWPAVETAIREFAAVRTEQADKRADRRQDADDEDEDEWAGEDPVAALKDYSDGLLRRAEAMKAVADSAGPLWATMTEEQKRRLPRLLHELNPRRPLHGPRWADRDDRERPWRRGPGWSRDERGGREAWERRGHRDRMSEEEGYGEERSWRRPQRDPMGDDEGYGER